MHHDAQTLKAREAESSGCLPRQSSTLGTGQPDSRDCKPVLFKPSGVQRTASTPVRTPSPRRAPRETQPAPPERRAHPAASRRVTRLGRAGLAAARATSDAALGSGSGAPRSSRPVDRARRPSVPGPRAPPRRGWRRPERRWPRRGRPN